MERNSRDKTKQTPSDTSAPRGLCACCELVADCTFPRQPGRPVMCCEEFKGATLVHDSVSARQALEGVPGQVLHSDPALRGLCRTCEHVDTCTYPKPAGGVWHCEEFR